jgi:hypothetical protein
MWNHYFLSVYSLANAFLAKYDLGVGKKQTRCFARTVETANENAKKAEKKEKELKLAH